MPSWPLCGFSADQTTQSVEDCIPTQSVGTRYYRINPPRLAEWISAPRLDQAEHLVEAVGQEVGIVAGQAHRRLDPEDVAGEAPLADQETALLAQLEQVGRLDRGGFLRDAVAHQLDAQHQAKAADL